jgi:hypothetical protein
MIDNPNVITEGSGRMTVRPEGDRVFVELVWDAAHAQEIYFLIGARDAMALGEALLQVGRSIKE